MKPLHNPLFIKFVIYFNENQDFFECHEVLEEYWKTIPNATKDHPLISYILLSTGMYHWRRENTVGALRTLKKARERFKTLPENYPGFSDDINFEELVKCTEQSISHIEEGKLFSSYQIVLTSPIILSLLNKTLPTMELLPFGTDAIIHKHLLRDRSDLIRKRDEKKKGRLL